MAPCKHCPVACIVKKFLKSLSFSLRGPDYCYSRDYRREKFLVIIASKIIYFNPAFKVSMLWQLFQKLPYVLSFNVASQIKIVDVCIPSCGPKMIVIISYAFFFNQSE